MTQSDSITRTTSSDEKAEFVEFFRQGLAQGNRDAFIEHFLPRITPDSRQRQPLARRGSGPAGFQRLFDGVFAAVPDLHGVVHRWGATDDGVLIEFTLIGTLGGKPITVDVVDRIVLREGRFVSNDTYFDPIPLLPKLLTRPRLALRLLPRFRLSRAELSPAGPGRSNALNLMAAGRLVLAVASLTAPQKFARTLGVRSSPELIYLTRIYGARALVMGLGYLTGGPQEQDRWKRFGLAVDICDTVSGVTHLLRRDVPMRTALTMVALTGSYAAIGASEIVADRR
ncbi:nuclear transport factor 2 family protein [Nocardia sp. NPDC046473]|uniref:nuclear transport factor 2 family protein n=1 Tax=Nocardia sp. NPDC046473 TaxID=3155733 RepID=UPI0034085F95